jgi:outer membrane immunogenic protein
LVLTTTEYSATKSGVTGGVQAGFDWQRGSTVLGIVADFNWADLEARTHVEPNNPAVIDQSFAGTLKWFGTVRGRAGLAVDDMLVYVTGGIAYASIESAITDRTLAGGGVNLNFSFTDTRWGLVGGVGAETALGGGWTLNSELLYMQFENNRVQPRLGPTVFNVENNDSAWVSRVGLNYRWNGGAPAAPVASYGRPARFAGFYVGGHAGVLGYTSTQEDQDLYAFGGGQGDLGATAFAGTAGIKVGWDWQRGHKLFGVVADINWTEAEGFTRRQPNTGGGSDQWRSSELSWFGTLRTRGGLVVDDVLIYVTGGLAAAKIKNTYRLFDPPGIINERNSFSDTRWGWTGGFGAEYAFWKNWSITSEVLYMQFRTETDTLVSPAFGRFSFENTDSAWVARAGVNYRFDPGPVVAKY